MLYRIWMTCLNLQQQTTLPTTQNLIIAGNKNSSEQDKRDSQRETFRFQSIKDSQFLAPGVLNTDHTTCLPLRSFNCTLLILSINARTFYIYIFCVFCGMTDESKTYSDTKRQNQLTAWLFSLSTMPRKSLSINNIHAFFHTQWAIYIAIDKRKCFTFSLTCRNLKAKYKSYS